MYEYSILMFRPFRLLAIFSSFLHLLSIENTLRTIYQLYRRENLWVTFRLAQMNAIQAENGEKEKKEH